MTIKRAEVFLGLVLIHYPLLKRIKVHITANISILLPHQCVVDTSKPADTHFEESQDSIFPKSVRK